MAFVDAPEEMVVIKNPRSRKKMRYVRLEAFRGRAIVGSAWSNTDVHGRGGGTDGNMMMRVDSTITEVRELFLQDGDVTRSYRLHNCRLPIHDGHDVTVVGAWANDETQGGLYLVVRNHTTDKAACIASNEEFKKLLSKAFVFPRESKLCLWIAGVLAVPAVALAFVVHSGGPIILPAMVAGASIFGRGLPKKFDIDVLTAANRLAAHDYRPTPAVAA